MSRHRRNDRWTRFCFALVVFLCTTTKGAELLPVATTFNAIGYQTEAEAAIAALNVAAEQSIELEQAGGIALLNGLYYPTNAVSNAQREHFSIRIQFTGKLIAIYHTHPGNNGDEDSFSKEDRAIASQMRVHSYIRAVASGGTYLLADNHVTQLGGHSLCHGIECKDYYALVQHKVRVLYGIERN